MRDLSPKEILSPGGLSSCDFFSFGMHLKINAYFSLLDQAQESAGLLTLHYVAGALSKTRCPAAKAEDALVEFILFRFMRTAAHK